MAKSHWNRSAARATFGIPLAAIPPAFGLLSVFSVAWTRDPETLPTFVWPDVAAAYLLSALPLAVMVHIWVVQKGIPACSAGLGAIGLSLSALLITLRPLESGLLRVAAALGWAMGIAWFFSAILGHSHWRKRHLSQNDLPVLMVIGALLLWLVPSTYVQARCRHDVDRLAELLQQTRLGEAQTLALRVLALDRSASLQESSLRQAVDQIERVVEQFWNGWPSHPTPTRIFYSPSFTKTLNKRAQPARMPAGQWHSPPSDTNSRENNC